MQTAFSTFFTNTGQLSSLLRLKGHLHDLGLRPAAVVESVHTDEKLLSALQLYAKAACMKHMSCE